MFETSTAVRERVDDVSGEPPVSDRDRKCALKRLQSIMRPASPTRERAQEAIGRRFRMENAGQDPRAWRRAPAIDPDCEALGRAAPGPGLAAMVDAMDISTASADELVDLAVASDRLLAWVNARQLQALNEMTKRELFPTAEPRSDRMTPEAREAKRALDRWRMARDEVAAALTISQRAADIRLDLAQQLCDRLPATLGALHRGDIDLARARVLVDELANLTVEQSRQVEASLLPRLGVLPAARLRREAAKQALILAPQVTADLHERAFAARRVTFEPAPNGMSNVTAFLSADSAAALRLALEAAAASKKADDSSDGRTMDQRRADALSEMAWLALDTGHIGGHPDGTPLARQHGQRVRVNLTVPFSTLIGLDDYPGELEGYGPIPAAVARRLAKDHPDATWRRLITNPDDGSLVWLDPQRYRPPADLAQHIVLRDRTCRGPTCNRSARYCDLDHTIPYPSGKTEAANLGPLCGNDHTGKHERGWRLTQPTPGMFSWTSPTGRVYVLPPEAIGPILGRDAPRDADRTVAFDVGLVPIDMVDRDGDLARRTPEPVDQTVDPALVSTFDPPPF